MARTDRNSDAHDEPAASSSAGVAIMPEPGGASLDTAGRATSRADADEMIARMADEQIDAMMAEEDVDPPSDRPRDAEAEAAIDVALQAASELTAIAPDLARNTAALVEREATELAAAQDLAPAAVEPPAQAAAFADTQAIEGVEAPPAAPPSFDPPRQADVDRGRRAEDEPTSSAEAVARELAADAAGSTPIRQTATQPPAAAAGLHPTTSHEPALPSGAAWHVALRRLAAVPRMALAAINLPAQPLGDAGREAMGAVAIVTLVNAMALLLYLMIYAR